MEKLIKLSFNKVKQHTFPKFYNTLFRFGGGELRSFHEDVFFVYPKLRNLIKQKVTIMRIS